MMLYERDSPARTGDEGEGMKKVAVLLILAATFAIATPAFAKAHHKKHHKHHHSMQTHKAPAHR